MINPRDQMDGEITKSDEMIKDDKPARGEGIKKLQRETRIREMREDYCGGGLVKMDRGWIGN